jgi:chemotaxis protein CheZ
MSIYEVCTLQDINGQRVTKVVSMLKVIEERIDSMVIAMGDMEPDTTIETEPRKAIDAAHQAAGENASTLHGPALPGQGTSQSDIDRIFAREGA